MPARRSRLLAAAAATAALLASGCSQENPRMIPQQDAEALIASLEAVGAAVDAGECGQATQALQETRAQDDDLPGEVADRLTERLYQGIEHLEGRIPEDCTSEPAETATPTPTASPTPTAEPTETPTPTPTETATPTATPTDTPPADEVEPDEGGGVSDGEDAPEQ